MKKSVSTNIPRKRKAESSSPRTSLDSQTSKGSGRSSLTKRSKTPWDIKTHLSNLQRDLENSNSQVSDLEKLNQEEQSSFDADALLKETLDEINQLEEANKTLKKQQQEEINSLKQKHEKRNEDLERSNAHLRSDMKELDEKNALHKTELSKITRENDQLDKEYTAQLEALQKAKSIISAKQNELEGLKYKYSKRSHELESHEKSVNELKENLKNKKQLMESLKQELIHQEELRRKLHNTIQELRGNIRVFCRIRPAVNEETKLADVRIYGEDNDSIELRDESVSAMGRSSNRVYNFTFDRVFSMEATQKDCFAEISQLVQSALDGYNVCIFAYGQTGSGKTFTMQGSNEHAGMIPRTVEQIYHVAQKLQPMGWDYNMTGQFLEIYNESIHDLLGNAADYGKVKHDIHHDKNGKTTVTDIATVQLNTPNQVRLMLKRANHNRATASTNLNDRSSRSHSVFTLHITGTNKGTGEETTGILNLIDLAGSERLSMSGAVGDRLKETQAINKSLSCLSKVIQSLASKKKEGTHIPYRDSKLTYLLRNSLGGNCKTLMFVNVSPLSDHFGETLCSLRFAETVNSTKLGHIKKMASTK